ncbi:probable inactive leucine-rich repeat receptor-like protein kinase At3g03770 [Andrographis paniculata]|uniref:probable inactive leucine-rich repeat receptor-like protein kinase At3g03770 n=1 Tax=Andrographis paniculata TaxID=175694 RepID=UPI0021E97D85|nr:probable inactive leucine-rich repeat receptor-like protein kinase At3g03770 [Andrographis paniculata]XP_051131752.1 probable inactive leucine-rich repeat receptor-like protein kinase At3g03770 [Andrographis paniculata]XP_051131753.1 probable inactive leucine-rich repeat receptor-like protein kinase At3g03770 [Andrographis paniculata]XP_051131754.1 probable inactive leucine-rich repeat receptor-like protein kinase At3g03770 [Andrographis paniculata]XP_051131755.1 probable inactive leucine-ri
MAKRIVWRMVLLVLCFMVFSVPYTVQLQSSHVQTLLEIKYLLNSPPFLNSWNNHTDFCNSEPSATLIVVCYEGSITQLHIVGDQGAPRLPENFSIDSFVATLVKLPSLKVLTLVSLGLWGPLPGKFMQLSSLEILNLTLNYFQGNVPESISSMEHLQTLILDSNNFTGKLPDGIGLLSGLAVLSIRNNSLQGSLPTSLGSLEDLRILDLSNNNLSGEVPDLSRLANLQVLDLGSNSLGPEFPVVSEKIERIVLRNNKFTLGIPEKVQSYYQLRFFDISSNRFVGPFPVSLLSLPSLTYMDISKNKLTGMLSENLPCNDELSFVSITANLLTGKLPGCLLSSSRKRTFLYANNCLDTAGENQQPISFCKNAALAVGMLPNRRKRKQAFKVVLAASVCGGVIGAVLLVSVAFFVAKRFLTKREERKPQPTGTAENTSTGYTSKFLQDARYITQAMKLGAIGLPPYRTFSLEELEAATNNFTTSTFIGEGSHSQMYRGQLRDGSSVAIRCFKLEKNHSTQYFMPHIEMTSKLRHHHLASALGHCFEYNLEDSCASRVFLVFEYVQNGTLRSWISERRARTRLTWAQRIAAATGVAKGIQFLHTGIVPGLFRNNLKITDVLVDQNLVAKISSYNLPLLSENMGKDQLQNFLQGSKKERRKVKHQDKSDIYDFGVILLEIISGKPVNTKNEVEVLKEQLQVSLIMDETMRKSAVDPAVRNMCSSESAKTMVEMCWRCLLKNPAERPSIEDVLWNLQFAAQVQDAWRGDSQSSEGSPISPLQSSRLKISIKQ